jgi:hydroxymethylpyrimidine/phosphomethylpyrimidine kinase / thiaminase
MVSTSGSQLLPREAVRQLTTHLLPLTTVLTPNVPEAQLILAEAGAGGSGDDTAIRTPDDLEAVGRRIRALGPQWVLVKGGHVPFRRRDRVRAEADADRELVVDVLVGPGDSDVLKVESAWLDSKSTHGTGCSLACKSSLP